MSSELEKLIAQSHDDVTIFKFEHNDVPCIVLEERKYDSLISTIVGKPVSVNTDLNILQDGLGHVFVEILLKFSTNDIVEKILVNANEHFAFFQSLSDTGMLAISSPQSHYGKENVFLIQLPKPEKARNALEIIVKGLHKRQ